MFEGKDFVLEIVTPPDEGNSVGSRSFIFI